MTPIINIYCKEKIILNWYNKVKEDLNSVYIFNLHLNLNSLKNELEIKQNLSIVIIDIENVNYSLFTKAYFNDHNNIKFIGVGYKKGVEQIIDLFENNIISYVSVEDEGLGLIKAINNVRKGKYYFCDETKDHLIENYIKSIKSKKIKPIVTDDYVVATNKNQEIVKELSPKEKKVSSLLAQGLSYKEIASVLGVTTFAINQNAKSIFKKLNVRSRSELSYRMLN
jgi:two-component system nitrate/nitrite response regulator NarL